MTKYIQGFWPCRVVLELDGFTTAIVGGREFTFQSWLIEDTKRK